MNQGYMADRYDYTNQWIYENYLNHIPVLTTAESVLSDLDWNVSGTNATSTSFALSATGGITGTTTTASSDQVIMGPATTAGQSGLNVAGVFVTDASPYMEFVIKTGASVANTRIWAGLKKTSTSVIATDSEQALFIYDSAVDTNWRFVYSIASTLVSVTMPQPYPIPAVAASTVYRLRVYLDANRLPYGQVTVGGTTTASQGNIWNPTYNFTAITTAVNLKPFIGIQTLTTAAKAFDVKAVVLGRKYV